MDGSASHRKSPRQQRSRETVHWILTAAAQLFGTYGYRSTTTNKIAERAGVSIGSLYQYFPNKDAVLVALVDQHMHQTTETVVQVIARARAQQLPLRELLSTVITTAVELHTREPGLHQLFLNQALHSPELVTRLREHEYRIADALASELRRVGAGAREPATSALLAVQGINAQIHGAVLAPPYGRDPGDVVTTMTRLWAAALLPTDQW